MSRLYIVFFFVIAVTAGLSAQDVQYVEDPVVTKMMERFVAINKSKTHVEGWRIQILATTDREKLESTKASFQYLYPNVPIDWIHTKPYYKLRAGAFSTKLEALRVKHILERDYNDIYLVKDDMIRPRELVGSY